MTRGREGAAGPLNPALGSPVLEVMNFLNEVSHRYPRAISFAPGRPAESFFDLAEVSIHIERYVAHRARELGVPTERVRASLGQYGRTNGIICDLLAKHLEVDEQISVEKEAIMVTSGAQEGMSILLQGLFDRTQDVILCTDPNYVGMTGAAAILGVEVEAVRMGPEGLELDDLVHRIDRVRRRGKRARALYDIPDFHNPMGSRLPADRRMRLLKLARAEGFLVIEDNPYGRFAFEDDAVPTLKALDRHRSVIYLGTFSKTLAPGLRVGYLVADQTVTSAARGGATVTLAEELAKVKSLSSVNTSALMQAAVGGFLLEGEGSLAARVEPRRAHYRARRDRMLEALVRHFGPGSALEGRLRWSRPSGGFFITVQTPFAWGERDVARCADSFGVVVCPMSFFSIEPGREMEIRLSFSYVSESEVDEGVSRLAAFVHTELKDAQQGRS